MSSTSLPPPLWSIDMHHSPNLANNVQLSLYKNQFDQESVRSVLSERSKKQNRNQKGMDINHINSNHVMVSSLSPYSELDHNRLTHTLQSQSTNRHSHHLFKSDRNYKSKGNYEIPSEKRRTNEVIEVQIIPQDDTWGDNTTAITGNTSERSISIDMELNKIGKEDFLSNLSFTSKLWMWLWPVITVLISFCAFFSPIIMILLPKIESLEWKVKECGPECDGQLINFAFKLLILLICTWALFFRSPKYTLPRICNYRSTILTLIIFLLISYWLFYSERIIDKRFNDYELSYYSIIQFSVSFIDVLLWIHYASIILIEIKQLQPTYFVKVVRSPDGESHFYNIGELSVQRAAIWILQKYYQDFSIYNPYLETLPRKTSKSKPFNKVGPINNHNHINLPNSTLKYYNVDEITNSSNVENILLNPSSGSTLNQVTNRLSMNGNANGISETIQSNCFDSRSSKRSCFSSHHHHHHNERFYEEHEYERRVKKRKARLLTSVEEAFTHIKRIQANESGPAIPMDPQEAAQAIFPSMARALQKFLKITRQQPRHTMKEIIDHLSIYLAYDLSPKSFLEKYFTTRPVFQNDKETDSSQTWSLICDVLLSRSIENGTIFMLRQDDISLLVTVHSFPHFNITEEIIDAKSNKFVFRLNSETSV